MLRDTSPGARLRGVPVSGSAHRLPAARLLCVGMLWLAAGPLAAQTVSLNASTSSALSEPCSSAKAVHDMRCPNYTGFRARLGGDAGAREAASGDGAQGLVEPQRPALGLRGGRDLGRGMASWYGPWKPGPYHEALPRPRARPPRRPRARRCGSTRPCAPTPGAASRPPAPPAHRALQPG